MTGSGRPVLLLLLFAALYLLPLPARPLFIQDETRYAEVPREMIGSGDWITPRINGLRYFEKPVMGYWLTAVSLIIFGENNFAVRFPSALATGLVALLLSLLCSRCRGRKSPVPFITVLVYLTSLGVAAIGTFGVLDPLLTLFLTGSMVAFFLATEEQGRAGQQLLFFVAGVCAGCAFLTKGFLAFVVPALTFIPYLLVQRRLRQTLPRLLLPACSALLVSLPWALLIHSRQPDFWPYFFWHEHVHRFMSETAQHKQPFWFFLAVLPAMFMPWTFLLPAVLGALRDRQHMAAVQQRLITFCICWFIFPLLFFSACNGKLITYILPCLPPLATLFGLALAQIVHGKKVYRLQQGVGATVVCTAVVLLLLGGVHLFGPASLHLFEQSGKLLLLCLGLAAMLLLLAAALRTRLLRRKITLFGFSFAVLLLSAHFSIPPLTLSMKAPGPLILRHASRIGPDSYVLAGEEVVRAVCWYLKREDVILVERAGELQYGLNYPESRDRLLSPAQAGAQISNHPGRVVLICGREEYSRWQHLLPAPVSVDSSGNREYLLLSY